jgi:hypothetical protein
MTPDEVVKAQEDLDYYLSSFNPDGANIRFRAAIHSAISLIQDYQKLKERVSVEKIAYQLFAEEFPQEPWADWTRKPQGAKQEWFDKAQAIITYLGGER